MRTNLYLYNTPSHFMLTFFHVYFYTKHTCASFKKYMVQASHKNVRKYIYNNKRRVFAKVVGVTIIIITINKNKTIEKFIVYYLC